MSKITRVILWPFAVLIVAPFFIVDFLIVRPVVALIERALKTTGLDL